MGFDEVLMVQPEGRRGGIWAFYNPNMASLIVHNEKTPHYSHALLKINPNLSEVLITGVYAPSTSAKRHELWPEIKSSLPPSDTPWLVLGDLNVVTTQIEKLGGGRFNSNQWEDMKMLGDTATLVDMGFQGNPYTWSNSREGFGLIRERLDHALANPTWMNTFPNTQVLHLPKTYSGH